MTDGEKTSDNSVRAQFVAHLEEARRHVQCYALAAPHAPTTPRFTGFSPPDIAPTFLQITTSIFHCVLLFYSTTCGK
jgi:hypothetical protein